MNGRNTPNQEVRQFRNAAQIASIYHKDDEFERKSDISELVHGTFHVGQLAVAVLLVVFHHVHHATNRIAQEENKDVPTLPEERNLVFAVFPVCVVFSLILAILRFGTRSLVKRPAIAMTICFVCATLMLIGSISAMRHAEIHINIEEVPDDELLDHPIFIHNYIICLISICGCCLYLIQSWILYDFWQWEKKEQKLVNTVNVIQPGSSSVSFNDEPTVSRQSGNERRRCMKTKDKKNKIYKFGMQEKPGILNPIATLDTLPAPYSRESQMDTQSVKLSVIQNPDLEPMNIYCCCIDLYRYTNIKYFMKKPTHEFQVVHVM